MPALLRAVAALAVYALFAAPSLLLAQTTTFTYQGSLSQSGLPANGNFSMEFSLFDDLSGGSEIGSTITVNPVPVSNGGFTVDLDFGASAFSGPARYLQITVNGTPLTPRRLLTSTSYAIRSLDSASVAGPISGANSVARLLVTNTQAGISNPSPANIPPAAVRGNATSPSGSTIGVIGTSSSQNGLGIVGLTSGTGILKEAEAIGVLGLATSNTGRTIGVSGQAVSPDGIAIDAQVTPGGNGYLFLGSNGSSSPFFVKSNGDIHTEGKISASGLATFPGGLTVNTLPANFNGGASVVNGLSVVGVTSTQSISVNGNVTVSGSLSVAGGKNNIVTLPDGRSVLLYANESPEYWYEDFGTVRLRNGRALVKIDPTFAATTNTGVGYKVFLTPNGNTRGLYVIRKTATTFEVRESNGGRSNISFDYRIVAKRRGYESIRFGQ